ncbi:hypothetical protein GE09DRAFT_1254789 [Coniochaeta sp. 2T2.1]|nr:hypothetical protein GE09DRAFT_1254789 [Coniochaeta sp. 2T2.1]
MSSPLRHESDGVGSFDMASPGHLDTMNAGTSSQNRDHDPAMASTPPTPRQGVEIEGLPFLVPTGLSSRRPRYSMQKYGQWVAMDRRPSVIDYFSEYGYHDQNSEKHEDDQDTQNEQQDDTFQHAPAPLARNALHLATSIKSPTGHYLHVEHTAGGFIRLHLAGTTSGATPARLLLSSSDHHDSKFYELGEPPGTGNTIPALGDMVVERTLVNMKFLIDAFYAMKARKHTLAQEWKRRNPDTIDLVLRQPYEVAAELNKDAAKLAELQPNPAIKVRYVISWDQSSQRAETGNIIYLKALAVRGTPFERDYAFSEERSYVYLMTGEEAQLMGRFNLVLPKTEDVYRRLCAVVSVFTMDDWKPPTVGSVHTASGVGHSGVEGPDSGFDMSPEPYDGMEE